MLRKVHLKVSGVDRRSSGQTEHEYTHQTACGYVRDMITRNHQSVDCKLCLREMERSQGIDDLSNYGGGN